MKFDLNYYTSGNYVDYLQREQKYKFLAKELKEFLSKFDIKSILDFGCGVGFLAKYLKCIGYDISEWAIKYGQKTYLNLTTDYSVVKKPYDLIIFLDVLEHIDSLDSIFDDIKTKYILVRIPVTKQNGGKYILNISENDSTHIIRKTKVGWEEFFDKHGFKRIELLHMNCIWDSSGVFCALFERMIDEGNFGFT